MPLSDVGNRQSVATSDRGGYCNVGHARKRKPDNFADRAERSDEDQVDADGSSIPPSSLAERNKKVPSVAERKDATAKVCSEKALGASNDEAAYWKDMFESLRRERHSAAEAQLHATKEESSRREKVLIEWIKYLEEEKKNSKEEGEEQKKMAATMASSDSMPSNKVLAKIEEQKRIIAHYQALTSVTISNTRGGERDASFDCTVVNHKKRKASKFHLARIQAKQNMDQGAAADATMKFEPVANPEHMPDFLRNAIAFESSDCPALLRNILDSFFPEEE